MPETLPSTFYRGTRQSNILPSATLGKIKHSAKVALPSARHSVKPGSRQNWALPSADPTRQKVAGPWRRPPAVRFCRVPNGWHSANFFFIFKNLFCRVPAPDTRQFFLKKHILPSASARHSAIFFYFWKSTLPSAPWAGTRQSPLCQVPPWHLAKKKFDFGPKFFPGALWQYFKLYFKIWGNFDFFLIYFISFFRFVDFFGIFQIWTAGTWNNGLWSSKNWYHDI